MTVEKEIDVLRIKNSEIHCHNGSWVRVEEYKKLLTETEELRAKCKSETVSKLVNEALEKVLEIVKAVRK